MNQIPLTSSPGTLSGEMLYRTLGRTGERISPIGLGGFHIGKPRLTDDDSIRLIRTAIDRGITFMDNSWDYHEGQSEVRRTLRASMIPLMPSPGKPKTVSTPPINQRFN